MSLLSKFKSLFTRKKVFKNESKPIKPDPKWRNPNLGYYGYDRPSKYLFQWSRLLQALVSQAGTWIFKKTFHTHECGIYKVEGGSRIEGVGDLVLGKDYCALDYARDKKEENQKMAELITNIVLKFDPMDPINSMVAAAAETAKCDVKALKKAVEASYVGGVFGGDALSDFFNWNPFGEPPIDREYKRWCLVDLLKKKTHAEVDLMYADQDLGKELLGKLQNYYREKKCHSTPLCCSPSRDKDGKLSFWINTGRRTQMDGWKTEEEIRKFIASGQDIKDTARY